MSLLTILIVLIAIGIILWLINNYLPLDATIKKIINVVVIIAIIIWLLKVFGLWAHLSQATL